MNTLEKQMLEHLIRLKENSHLTGLKAEFEAEGMRREEMLRLMELAYRSNLGLNLKIGGCEAITDLQDALRFGVHRVIAPMVETPYALKKFLNACATVFSSDVAENMECLVNIETVTAANNLPAMLNLPGIERLNGIVIGRVDMVGSMQPDSDRSAVESEEMLSICTQIAKTSKAHHQDVVIGGGISADSMPFLKRIPAGHLDRYETRKLIFNCPHALGNPATAFIQAIEFEIFWLKNKQCYYQRISKEDESRITMLQTRLERIQATQNIAPLSKIHG